ncbi:MAG: glycosyltransferase [Cellulosilyticaceae bacterium]
MRIAMLTNNYKPFVGGVPISIERLSEGLRALGHEVYIFAPTYDDQEADPYVIRYRSYTHKLKGNIVMPHWFDREIAYYFEVLQFDMIHVHHPALAGWMGAYLGKKYNIPVAYTYHTRYEQYIHYFKPFEKLENKAPHSPVLKTIKTKVIPDYMRGYSKYCDLIFAPTQLMEEVLGDMRVETPIEVLPTGLDQQFFEASQEHIAGIRQRYKGDKQHLFCSVSRLSKEKNISFMIEGLVQLKATIGDTFQMLLIGDGPERHNLEQQVKSLGLDQNVSFLGSIPNQEMKHYYGAADLFLFASQSETQGIVLLEAMAAHSPVVAIEASGVVEVVANGHNGYMTPADLSQWVAAIQKVIQNKAHFESLCQGAYETARRFTGERIARQAEHYYQKAILARSSEANMQIEETEQEGVYYVS